MKDGRKMVDSSSERKMGETQDKANKGCVKVLTFQPWTF